MQDELESEAAAIADKFDATYRVDDIIGKGSVGVVHKGWHKRLDKAIAIKFLHPQLLSDPKQVRQFLREARQLGRLDHPNIVTIYSAGINQAGQPFIVMELIEGGTTLDDRLKEKATLTFAEFETIFAQILSAMVYLEENGIAHRDLKPSNILLYERENGLIAKVADFGIAKSFQPDMTNTQAETNSGQLKGSPAYMSPEQCSGGKLDHRSDIYSLACVMYTCLVGRPPFKGETPFAVMYQHAHAMPDPLPSSVPKTISRAIQKALQKTPEKRFNTCADFRKKVLNASNTISLKLQFPAVINAARAIRSRLLLLVVAVALMGGISLMIWQPTSSPDSETSEGPTTIAGDTESLFKRILAERKGTELPWDLSEIINRANNRKEQLSALPESRTKEECLIRVNDILQRSYGYSGNYKKQIEVCIENDNLFIDNAKAIDKLADQQIVNQKVVEKQKASQRLPDIYVRTQTNLADHYANLHGSIPNSIENSTKAAAYAGHAYGTARELLRGTEGTELLMRKLSQMCVIQHYFLGNVDLAIKWSRKNLRHIPERKQRSELSNGAVLCEQAEKIMDGQDLPDQSLLLAIQYALDAKEKALDRRDFKLVWRANAILVRAYRRYDRNRRGQELHRAMEFAVENLVLSEPRSEKTYSWQYVQALRDISDVRASFADAHSALRSLTVAIKYIRSFEPLPKESLPELASAYLRRVQLMYAVPEPQRNYEAMQRSTEKILELDLEPTRTPMHEAQYWMAVCLDHNGDKVAAKKHLQKYLEISSKTGRWSEDCSEEKAKNWLEKL